MRYWLAAVVMLTGSVAGASLSWGDSSIFATFFAQREVVATVAFERGSSALTATAARQIDDSLAHLKTSACEARLLRIEGYAGQKGDAERLFRLSMNRAWSVARFLEKKGIPCLVGISGYGDLQATAEASADDQLVEIAAYPRMFYFDFATGRIIDEDKLP